MKNIHVLPTENESRLRYNSFNKVYELCEFPKYHTDIKSTHNIYITSDEEIKEGDYWLYICPINGLDYGDNNKPIVKNNLPNSWFEKLHDRLNYKKIILTTDQDLIKDGVQVIDDEFLEWFVKNPSCESVKTLWTIPAYKIEKEYRIEFPKEEAKQETLEEAAEKFAKKFGSEIDSTRYYAFINGAKWQQERIQNLRDELYNQLPTGEVNAFDLIKIINSHIKKLDELI